MNVHIGHIEINIDNSEHIAMTEHSEPRELTQEAQQRMQRLLLDLLAMDDLAREQGHSLVEILGRSARDQLGIDIKPALKAPPEKLP